MRLFFVVVLLFLIGVKKMKWVIIIGACIVAYIMWNGDTAPAQTQKAATTQSADRKPTAPVILEPSTTERIQAWLVEHTPKK
jgi:hypothetical protein